MIIFKVDSTFHCIELQLQSTSTKVICNCNRHWLADNLTEWSRKSIESPYKSHMCRQFNMAERICMWAIAVEFTAGYLCVMICNWFEWIGSPCPSKYVVAKLNCYSLSFTNSIQLISIVYVVIAILGCDIGTFVVVRFVSSGFIFHIERKKKKHSVNSALYTIGSQTMRLCAPIDWTFNWSGALIEFTYRDIGFFGVPPTCQREKLNEGKKQNRTLSNPQTSLSRA